MGVAYTTTLCQNEGTKYINIGDNMKNLVDNLVTSTLRANYARFVENFGYDEADRKMTALFGDAYYANRQDVWQWYDKEYMGVA